MAFACAIGVVLALPLAASAGSAFTARDTSTEPTGQVQYVNREGGTGQGQETFHGTVECLRVEGDRAEISGLWKDGSGAFHILVVDNGEGAAADDES